MRKITLLPILVLSAIVILTETASGQLSITSTGTDHIINFEMTVTGVNNGQFAGTGLEPSPATGRLDSDAWATTGMDEGISTYGDTKISGDFARGVSNGNVSLGTGGFYSFQVATGDYAFGTQPTGNDWTPGTMTLRIKNNTGLSISGISFSYNICVYNDQPRSNSFNFSYSIDSSAYIQITDLNYSTPTTATSGWTIVPRSYLISGLSIANGASFFFRWNSDDVLGTGGRDEIALDDITINVTAEGVSNPAGFNAESVSPYQIDLTWNLNNNNDSVLIATNLSNTFGTPAGDYSLGSEISGGGTVIYKGTGIAFSHSGLTSNTAYYYKAWSMTVANEYSTGTEDNATTLKIQPSEYPTLFAVADTGITITATWTDAGGTQPPDGYLIRISSQDNIAAPVDGTPVTNDLDLSDGTGAVSVAQGVGKYTFYRLQGTTTYYLKIFPYTNSGSGIDFLTDDPAPAGNATTQSIVNTNDFESGLFGDWDTVSLAVKSRNWSIYATNGAYGTAKSGGINGYQTTDTLENDWLISPSLNLDAFADEYMVFFTWWRYGTDPNELKLKYSTDYVGGDPSLATWAELSFAKSSVEQTWTPSGFIDLKGISGTNVHLAFHYLSVTGPRWWLVDEIEITGDGISNPADFSAQTASMTEISLSWTKNTSLNDVLVAFNTIDEFGIPEGQLDAGAEIPGGGTVLYHGQDQSFLHTELTPATTYFYKAWSVDPDNNYSPGVAGSATTQYPEPSGNPTGLTATANGFSNITVTWTDSDASGYLVKASSTGFDAIASPVDLVPQSDSLLVKNVAASVQSAQFNGLIPATTYYFKIYPYNGSGSSINYKIDGEIPEASATTGELDPEIFISEVAESADNFNIRFVEIHNAGTTSFNFNTTPVYLCMQANAGPSWNSVKLSGTLAPGGNHVVAYSAAYFDTAYSSAASQYSSTVCNFNGDDGIFLYYGGNQLTGILFDAYGQINVLGNNASGWNYLDGHVVRKRDVVLPNPVWTAAEWSIIKTTNYDQMTPYLHKADVTWQGTTSTDWNRRGNNWSGAQGWVPDASCNVIIPNVTNYPVVTRKSACNLLDIQTGSALSIQSTGTLQIVGP
ncbi:MAG TPA: hypothetical protein PLW31_10400 [Bacteroidales bacterium]|nr:hypothetical protein [Bacteroidales bacterium]